MAGEVEVSRFAVGRNRVLLAYEPGHGYPVGRMALEDDDEEILLKVDGRTLDRFHRGDLACAIEALRRLDPGPGDVFEVGLLADIQ